MKRFFSLVLALCLAFSLTAFAQEETRPFTTLNGDEVLIPVSPKRIVALTGIGDLIPLGIVPVATMNSYRGGDFAEVLKDVVELEETQPYDAEEILAQDPDLIITYQRMDREDLDTLSAIAPIVPVKSDSLSFEERIAYLGEVFQMQDKANEVIAKTKATHEAALARAKKIKMQDKTVSCFSFFEGVEIPVSEYFMFNTMLYDEFGFAAPERVQKDIFEATDLMPFFPVSMELLPEFSGDFIFTLMDPLPADLADNSLWQALPAVQNGRTAYLDMMLFASKDVMYQAAQYDLLLNALAEAFGEN